MTTLKITTAAILLALISISQIVAQDNNYIVMLDLSDRLLINNQPVKDKALIMSVFNKFEKSVRNKLIINSKDSFKISIAPQVGGIEASNYTEKLQISMANYGIADKRKKLDAFKVELPKLLNKLYVDCLSNKSKSSDFNGSDIWKYFNDNLPNDLVENSSNNLFVLTDGYFDFESNRFVGKMGNRTTDSRFLKKLRSNTNWKSILLSKTEGLIPVDKSFKNMNVCVLEIKPKYGNLNEQDMIFTFWQKWLKEMKITKFETLASTEISTSDQKIKLF